MWAVTSADRTNAHGRPTGYRLVPGHGTATLLAQPGSSVDRRAGFARHTLWVTPYDAGERFPAGAYPYQHADPGGLPAFSATSPRGRGRRPLVHGRRHPVRPPRGLADHADDQGRARAAAGRLLRPQPDLDMPPPESGCCHGHG